MKRWQFWLGIAISAVFMWLALRGLELSDVWKSLKTANYWWLIPGVATYFVGVWARAWRWHYLLRPLKSIRANEMFAIITIGYMSNNVYPGRPGEVLRAFILRRRQRVPFSAGLATVIVERIFDGVVMIMFVVLNLGGLARLLHHPGFVSNIQTMTVWAAVAFAAALIVLLLVAMFPHQSLGLYHRFGAPLISQRFRGRINAMVVSFSRGLESLRSAPGVFILFVTSVLVWLLETAEYWLVMHAFSFSVSFFTLMLMSGIMNLATSIPSSPGYVGTFDTPGIVLLTVYGVAPAVAAGYILTLHAALWLPITLLGIYYLTREGLSWDEVKAGHREIRGAEA